LRESEYNYPYHGGAYRNRLQEEMEAVMAKKKGKEKKDKKGKDKKKKKK
jgi:hypothetical protein